MVLPARLALRSLPSISCPSARLTAQLQARRPHKIGAVNGTSRAFGYSSALYEKKYTKDHEWIELSPDGKIGTIGVSTYAAKALGDVVFVELPSSDTDVAAGDTIGAVESVKSASDIMTPLSGKIVEANELLQEKPGTINKEPEAGGWIAKIEIGDEKEIDTLGLMDGEAYAKFTEE